MEFLAPKDGKTTWPYFSCSASKYAATRLSTFTPIFNPFTPRWKMIPNPIRNYFWFWANYFENLLGGSGARAQQLRFTGTCHSTRDAQPPTFGFINRPHAHFLTSFAMCFCFRPTGHLRTSFNRAFNELKHFKPIPLWHIMTMTHKSMAWKMIKCK